MFFVLTGNKTALKTLLLRSSLSELPGKQASRLVPSLAQIKLLSILIADSYIHYFCQQDPLPGNMKWSEVTQLCSTLWDPTDCSLQGSSIHGIFQARVLAWVTMSFSRGSSDPGIEPGAPALQTLYHLSHTYHQPEPTASACLLCVWCSRWQWKGHGRRPSAGLWRIGLVNFEYRHLPSWKKENCVTELKTIKWKAAVPRTTLRSSS